MLKKTVGNWVDGDRFFDRESDLAALHEHVCQDTHTLIVSGSVGITPILKQAGLSAAMNVFSPFVLNVLVHDGYFIRRGDEFRFASGLLEDWQRSRRGLPIAPLTAI